MGKVNAREEIFAGLLAGGGDDAEMASQWSSFIMPNSRPDATVRASASPFVVPPKITERRIALLGQNDPEADYSLVGRLGEGGMGVVFEARQQHLERTVALKMIRPDQANDTQTQNNFFYEAVITAGLEHPGIIPVLEFGKSLDGRVFYTMKKVRGVPWSRVLRKHSLADNLEIFNRVVDVVAYAHANGVIHRDLKPGNVLLGEFGVAWVSDWGLAVQRNDAGDYSHAYPGGTPQYMPPEMARLDAMHQGPASDVYLLGGILFELLTGLPPHPGETSLATLQSAAQNHIHPVETTAALHAIGKQAMAAIPSERYAGAMELQQAVRQCLADSECSSMIQRAGGYLMAAQKKGDYELYQLAIADYSSALSVNPANQSACNGRQEATNSYARSALAKGEFDLALSIISPIVATSDEAAILATKIKLEREQRNARVRRNRRIMMLSIATAILILFGATALYLHSQQRVSEAGTSLAVASQQLGEAKENIKYATKVAKNFDEMQKEGLRNVAVLKIQWALPGGLGYFGVDWPPTVHSGKSRRSPVELRTDEIIGNVDKLLKQVKQMAYSHETTKSDTEMTKLFQLLKSLRPHLQDDVQRINAMGSIGELEPKTVKIIVKNLEALINQPEAYDSPEQ